MLYWPIIKNKNSFIIKNNENKNKDFLRTRYKRKKRRGAKEKREEVQKKKKIIIDI